MNTQTCNTPAATLNELFRTFSPPRIAPANPWRWAEKDDAWKGEIDLPGFTKDEVNVTIDKDRVLLIEAKQSELPEGETRDFVKAERGYRVRLPRETDAEKLDAKLENGVLQITLPKLTPDSQIARRIDLN